MSKENEKLSRGAAGRLQLIWELMNVPEDYDEDGKPIGEITSLITKEEAIKLLNGEE